MPIPIFARPPYTKRKAPPSYDAGWFDVELGNLQRAIPPSQVRTLVASATLTSADAVVLVDATAGAVSVTLPMPSQVQGFLVTVKKIDASANAVTLVGTIDGAANPTLPTRYKSKTIVSDGTTYFTLATV